MKFFWGVGCLPGKNIFHFGADLSHCEDPVFLNTVLPLHDTGSVSVQVYK